MVEDYKTRLVNYIKKNLRKGYTEESLKWALVNQGYSRILVQNALELATKELAFDAPLVKERPKIVHTLIDENNMPINIKKSWWKKIFGI
jgi:hypothetical protein